MMLSPYFTLSNATQREGCAFSVLYLFSFCFLQVKAQNENIRIGE